MLNSYQIGLWAGDALMAIIKPPPDCFPPHWGTFTIARALVDGRAPLKWIDKLPLEGQIALQDELERLIERTLWSEDTGLSLEEIQARQRATSREVLEQCIRDQSERSRIRLNERRKSLGLDTYAR